MNKSGRLFFCLFCSFLIHLVCSSCSLFSKDFKHYLEYYSDSAEVGKVIFPETVGTANNGLVCIDSKTDKTFNLVLRNPQRYGTSEIIVDYEFNNPAISVSPIITLNEDLLTATMTFPQAKLKSVDNGDSTDEDGNIVKDISGILKVWSEITRSYYDGEYPVKFMVNSAPERIRGAMFQINGKKATIPNYVVAFNAPKIEGTVHNADTHHIYIGKNHWEFTGDYNLTPVSVESGCSLSKTKPSPLYDLDDNDSTFNSLASEGYVPLYFTSNEIMDISSRVVTYKLSIIDDYGLSTNTVISNVPNKLQPPKFSSLIGEASTYPAEEESEEFKFVINHFGDTYYIDEDGTEKAGATCKNPVMIDYVVKKSGTVIESGVKRAPVTINLPSATGYAVEAYAYSDGVIDSVKNTSKQFGVSRSNIYYVSQNAEDSGTGSKAKPYRTIAQCFDTIYQQYSNNASYTINLLSDISAQGEATFFIPAGDGNDYNYIKNTIVTVQGYGGVRKIRNIEVTGEYRDAYSAISVVNVPKMTLKLKNLEITSEYGAGIEANSSNAVDIELENVTVKDCVSNGGWSYAGLYFNTTGKLTLSNCTIVNNTARLDTDIGSGAGVYVNQGSIAVKNKVVIKDNVLKLIHENEKTSNLYLNRDGEAQIKLQIEGPLTSDSRIGVATEKKSMVGDEVIFTQGYYTYNPRISPSSIFQSDDNFGVCWENPTANSGEASLVKSGSLMLSEFYEDIQIELNQDRTYTAGLKLVPTLKLVEIVDGEPVPTVVSSSKVKWDVTASVYGEDFTSLCTVQSDGTIIIPNSVVKDKYAIYIQVVYQGKYYSVTKYIDARSLIYLTTTSSIPSGTELKVTTWDELAAISSIIGTGTNPNLEGVKIMLERDITIPSDTRWTPIGNFATPFKGTFDGNNKTISGINIDSGNYKGLFGVTENAVIRNVTVEGSI